MDIHGVVVLYNPGMEIIKNIQSYIHSLTKLYVIDNSDDSKFDCEYVVNSISNKVQYVGLEDNKGIATALNIGCRLAQQNGADWVLTMDQDSFYDELALDTQIKELSLLLTSGQKKIGIFSSNHKIEGYSKPSAKEVISEQQFVITSGNLVSLSVFDAVGGFKDDMFIDEVDIEFCYRVTGKGYKIFVANSSILNHFLGETRSHRVFFLNVMCSHHPYVRRYYITRNRLYMTKLYPKLRKEYCIRNLVSIIKVVLLERDKWLKIRAFWDGVVDGSRGVYGKKKFHY